jgi:cystathionine beta-lyase
MKNLDIHVVHTTTEQDHSSTIRRTVFVTEQHVPEDLEFDGLDNDAIHFIIYYNNTPIGCARLRIYEDTAKLERIAILKKYRGNGYGTRLTEYLIEYCKNKNLYGIFLHSQTYVSNFYENLGFKPKGNTFYEAGLEHIAMERII